MTLLDIKDLFVSYGPLVAVQGISFQVRKGQVVSLLGSNGAGKTTTLRAISGTITLVGGKVTGGSISFDGQEITKVPPHRRVRKGISLVPEGRKIFHRLTVYENLVAGGYTVKDFGDRLEFVYQLFPILKERRNQIAGSLSGGEQQMLAIARGLMSNPKLLLLDEPSLGLAPRVVDVLYDAISKINEEGTTVLVVEQHVKKALDHSHYIYVIQTGRIIASGEPEEVLSMDMVKAYLG
ncbi:MAG: ABC transporter ATP-binding protein [Candidatus Korarchaeota archaeon]|nr:ABC transporter ATP-binding protein [Candidatus Korarchaeota archaeon]